MCGILLTDYVFGECQVVIHEILKKYNQNCT